MRTFRVLYALFTHLCVKGIIVPNSQSEHILVTVGWLCGFAMWLYSLRYTWRPCCGLLSWSALYTIPLTLSMGEVRSCSIFVLICCVIVLSYSLKRPAGVVVLTRLALANPKILRISEGLSVVLIIKKFSSY